MLNSVQSKIQQSIVLRSLKLIPSENRRKVVIATLLQIGLSILDLIGVAAIGILGALSVTGIQSQQPGARILRVLEFLQIDSISFQSQVAILGLSACVIFIFRTVCSIVVTRKVLFFLSRQGAQISVRLLNQLLGQSLLQIQSRSTQEIVYGLTTGVSAITLGVLAASVALIADASLLIVLLVALFAVDYIMAITSVMFFGLMGYLLYRTMSVKAQELGVTNSKLMDARIWVLVRTRNFSLNWLQVIEHHAFKFLKYNGQ
jgi:ABC-type multidrug transport system fused ATPase/permease subunit